MGRSRRLVNLHPRPRKAIQVQARTPQSFHRMFPPPIHKPISLIQTPFYTQLIP